MQARDYFPLGIASGDAFCNRTSETALLVDNMNNCKHTLLIATRRYGKSSLALRAIQLSKLPFVEVDFYMASSEKVIETYILNGIADLIGKALGPIEKLTTSIKKYVKNIKPKMTIGTESFKLELTTETASDPATNVKEGLLLLEKLLEEKKKHAVYLMDEFQSVGIICQGAGIEAAIRHVAQKTKYLTFIFSGSSRRLLKTMFEDENRPLYKLCWKMSLERISVEHYQKYIQYAANALWKCKLKDDVINSIISLTERHPFYLNKLCDRLWTVYANQPPSLTDVIKTWGQILAEEKSDAIKEISSLSLGQKKVVQLIARDATVKLTVKKSILELQMTNSSIIGAIEGLEEKDCIEQINGQYQIINPIVRFYVLNGSNIGFEHSA